jgi:hypothetical protein
MVLVFDVTGWSVDCNWNTGIHPTALYEAESTFLLPTDRLGGRHGLIGNPAHRLDRSEDRTLIDVRAALFVQALERQPLFPQRETDGVGYRNGLAAPERDRIARNTALPGCERCRTQSAMHLAMVDARDRVDELELHLQTELPRAVARQFAKPPTSLRDGVCGSLATVASGDLAAAVLICPVATGSDASLRERLAGY